jgi:hypothetical protein
MNKILKAVKTFIISLLPEKYLIVRRYKKEFGIAPNLKNPKLFTEKIQWLKLNDKNPLKTQCTDKLTVRKYITSKVGSQYLIPLIFDTDNVDDICSENLPNYPVIIKPNHDSGGGYVILDREKANYTMIKKNISNRLNQNYYHYSGEWEYRNIEPKIVIEKFLTDERNALLDDYKIHCFNGQPLYIQTIFDRESNATETWFNTKWEKQDFYYFSKNKANINKPKTLDEMLIIARKLSQDFTYVRVDLYSFKNKVYFGELTFHPFCGVMKWQPSNTDRELGGLLNISK